MLKSRKTGVLLWLVMIVLAFVVIMPFIISGLRLRAMPEQKIWVQAVAKELRIIHSSGGAPNSKYYIVTFESSDGLKINLRVKPKEAFDSIQEGDAGILTYKGKDSEKFNDKIFINFEKE